MKDHEGAKDDEAARTEVSLPHWPEIATGLGWRNSHKISAIRPTAKKVASVCTRQNGSLSQSHSCPLLSITSQETMTITRSDRPIESKRNGRLFNSARCFVR